MARTPERIRRRWEIHYRDDSGRFGIVGWVTFKTKKDAEEYAAKWRFKTDWVNETWVEHPAKCYSDY